jgi:hypothetical protein
MGINQRTMLFHRLSNLAIKGKRQCHEAAWSLSPWHLLVGRMPWISRPTVDAYVTAITALLFFLFDAPVTRSAQGLEVTKPKRPFVALMRHDMISVSRGDNLSIL